MSFFRHRLRLVTFARQLSSSVSTKVPLLYKLPDEHTAAVTLQLYSWGRGSSGQLGSAIEEIRMYPVPVANFLLPLSFALSLTPGRIGLDQTPSTEAIEVGISCGLFHSSILVNGELWIWGKGDGGRLGFGHEHPVFVPTKNPNLEKVRSVALGGLHSVALTSAGEVFTWWVLAIRFNVLLFCGVHWHCLLDLILL